MPRKYDKCVKQLLTISDGVFSRDEAQNLMEKLQDRYDLLKQVRAENNVTELEKIGREFVEKEVLQAKMKQLQGALKTVKLSQKLKEIDQAKNIPEYFTALYGGTEKVRDKGRLSVDAIVQSEREQFVSDFMRNLTAIDKDAERLFFSGDLDRRIAWKLHELQGGELKAPSDFGEVIDVGTKAKYDKVADGIARLYDKMDNFIVDRQNLSGAGIIKLKGRITRQWNNPEGMIYQGREKWKTFARPLLDESKLEPGTDVNKFLDSFYDSTTTGVRLIRTGDMNQAAMEYSRNLASSAAAERVFHFKSPDDFVKYNQSVFGHGSIATSIMGDLEKGIRNASLFEQLGTNPEAFHDELVSLAKENERRKFSKNPEIGQDRTRSLESAKVKWSKNILREITGYTAVDLNPTLSAITASAKTYQATINLTASLFRSIPDLMNGPQELALRGGGYFNSFAKYYGTLLGLSSDKEALRYVKTYTDSMRKQIALNKLKQLGGFSGVFFNSNVPKTERLRAFAGGVSSKLFSINGLHWWDDSLKNSMRETMVSFLGDFSKFKYNELPNQDFLRSLKVYGIGPAEWDTLRQFSRELPDKGGVGLFSDLIHEAPNDLIDNYLKSANKTVSDYSRQRARHELGTLLNTYIHDAAEHTVLSPGATERSLMTWGHQRGHPVRIIADLITHMKGFMISNFRRNYGRAVYGRGSESLIEALSKKQELAYIGTNVVGGALMFMVGDMALSLANGKTPPDTTKSSNIMKWIAGGGGLGLYADVLLRDYEYGRNFSSSLLGPMFSQADRAAQVFTAYKKAALGEEELGKANSQLMGFAIDSTPFMRAPGLRWALNELMLYQLREAAQPGYMKRLQDRTEKDSGSTFLFHNSQ